MRVKLAADVQKEEWWAGTALPLASRWTDHLGTPVTIADVESMTVTVIELGAGTPLSGFNNTSVDMTGVVFDELQTPPSWNKDQDRKGFNILYVTPPEALPESGKTYRLILRGTLTVTEDRPQQLTVIDVWEITTKDPNGAN